MDPELVFNELSASPPAADIPTARARVSDFLRVILAARQYGFEPAVRAVSDLNDLVIGPDYRMFQWRNDPEVELEQRTYFRGIVSKYPVLTELPTLEEMMALQEFLYDGQGASGLGAAYLIGGLAVSLGGAAGWDRTSLVLEGKWIDAGAELQSEEVSVMHASSAAHIVTHAAWIRGRFSEALVDGDAVWEKRAQVFPALVFCQNVREQLLELKHGNPILRAAIDRLEKLNAYGQSWVEGGFQPNLLHLYTRPESEATRQQFGLERTFECPDGEQRLFSWHCDLSRKWRLHYFPEAASRRIFIGYIGRHLRTVRFPN